MKIKLFLGTLRKESRKAHNLKHKPCDPRKSCFWCFFECFFHELKCDYSADLPEVFSSTHGNTSDCIDYSYLHSKIMYIPLI